jgi:predicted PurR-regulated permease PerM
MQRPTNRQLFRWLLIGLIPPIVGLNLYVVGQVLIFFRELLQMVTIAAILAFLLDYPVKLLRRWRVNHALAVLVVFLITIAVLTVLGVALVPILIDQINQLANRLPQWLTDSETNLQGLNQWAQHYNFDLQGLISRTTAQINGQLEQQAQNIAKVGVGVALGTLSSFVNGIFIFVLAFYMLLYGKTLWRGLLKFLPADLAQPFDRSLKQNFHGFFLSQLLLAGFMTVLLIPIFLWLKVPFALLFALLIGLAELIPLIGAALGIGGVCLILLFQDGRLAFSVGLACMILQQIRDNVIGPKLMGEMSGLNPIYIFMVLLIGLQVGGVLGAFLAVPIAGTIKDTVEAIARSRQSPIEPEPIAQNPTEMASS